MSSGQTPAPLQLPRSNWKMSSQLILFSFRSDPNLLRTSWYKSLIWLNSRPLHAGTKDNIIPRNVSNTIKRALRTGDDPLMATYQRCVTTTRRMAGWLMGKSVPPATAASGVTIEWRSSITLRSTRPNSVLPTRTKSTAASMETTALLHTMRANSRSLC